MDSYAAPRRMFSRILWILGCILLVALLAFYFFTIRIPNTFPSPLMIHIEKGESVSGVGEYLEQHGYIDSSFAFKIAATLMGGIQAGDYFFENPASFYTVVSRIAKGDFKLEPIRVTFPEGSTVSDMSLILMRKIPDFYGAKFAALGREKEGYLFPDTYLFLPNVTPETVIATMEENFDTKIESLKTKLQNYEPISTQKLKETVVLASIIEEETNTAESRRVVSGILHQRMEKGIPLQVDAPFAYVIGKSTYDLTLEDLKIDSPFNTYKYKGLPPSPISNPGLDSIIAALEPTKSPYLFYLTERDGTIHYAKTYAEHLVNKEKYVK